MTPNFMIFAPFWGWFWLGTYVNLQTRPSLYVNFALKLLPEKVSAQANPGEGRYGLPKLLTSYTKKLH